MADKKLSFLILFFGGLLAVFVFLNGTSAQEIDKNRAIEIVQSQGGPAGCSSEESCRTFCDNPDNVEICINWARQNGLISSAEASKAEKLAKVGREFSGPGRCQSREECERFCGEPQNHNVCLDFAVQQGFLTSNEAERIKEFRRQAKKEFEVEIEIDPDFDKDRARQILETQGGPGGCQTFEECAQFCDQPQNQEVCFQFAERHSLFKNKEHAEKIKKIISEGGPGRCRGERQCRAFCENPDNFEACIEFAQKHEFIKPEQVEKAKRGIQALKEGGPNGCKSPKECEEICRKQENQNACFEWAKKHRFVSEEQIRMMEEFKQRREEFKPPEGFAPPEHSPFPSPAFTVSPEHIKTCAEKGGFWAGSYCKFPGSTEYTPPPEYTPIYSPAPKPEFYYEEPAIRCAKEGGTWNVETKTCVIQKGDSILQNSGAYIRNAFRDFFFR